MENNSLIGNEWISVREIIGSGRYKRLGKSYSPFVALAKQGYVKTRTGIASTGATATYYKKSDLDELLWLFENYLSDKEILIRLGYMNTVGSLSHAKKSNAERFIPFFESVGIEYKYFENGLQSCRFYVNKEQFLDFLNTHIQTIDVPHKYKIEGWKLNRLEKKHNVPRIVFNDTYSFYRLEDANKYFNVTRYDEEELYTKEQSLKILGLENIHQLKKIRKEENIEPVRSRTNSYLKQDINNLLEKMEEIKNKYCTSINAAKICNLSVPPKHLPSYPATGLAKCAFGDWAMQQMYTLDDVYSYKKRIAVREKVSQAFEKSPVEAFEEILNIENISFSKSNKYTGKEWDSFCKEKLLLLRGSKQNIKSAIRNYVNSTVLLVDLTKEKELFSLSSNDINLGLFNQSIGIESQIKLYSFVIEYHSKLSAMLLEKQIKTKLFNLEKIISPHQRELIERPKELYKHSEYILIYDYVKQMTHKDQAILDAERIIRKKGMVFHYASYWLYVLTHLGNAWRHGDVMSLPTVDLKRIGLSSLETLKKRDLTTEEANAIVNQLKQKDFLVGKTNVITRFNCPDDLVLPFATAAAICSLIVVGTTGIITDDKGKEVNKNMISFGMKNENTFPKRPHNAFFKGFKKDDFKFQSLKMNRTVLVLMYMVLVRKGRSSSALELAQKLRAHEDFESTNIYLVIPDEELDKLCESLFNRKPFGYIHDLMATILLGDTEDRHERTQEIIALNSTFGGVLKLEATAGFINKTLAERKRVTDEIFKMGLDKVTDLMFDLEVGALPSHEENIQCLFSGDCRNPELECKDCPYSVMNFYAISSLVEGIKTNIHEFFREFEADSFEGEKTRLMNVLYKDMDNLERAMQKFGEETVFNFFKDGKEEYDGLLDLLDQVQSRTGEDFERYLTYTPAYLN
ncbi:UNVERIFIED_ORG: hypothetical protein QFZ59_002516 [Bacillus sp. B2I3]|nr:hypothetical protein [Bacillus sp. B2I3]